MEQYTKINNVVITGLNIKPRSYAKAVTAVNGTEPDGLEVSSAEQQVGSISRVQSDHTGSGRHRGLSPSPPKERERRANNEIYQ